MPNMLGAASGPAPGWQPRGNHRPHGAANHALHGPTTGSPNLAWQPCQLRGRAIAGSLRARASLRASPYCRAHPTRRRHSQHAISGAPASTLAAPAPAAPRVCSCHGRLDALGDHQGACATSRVLASGALPRAVARVVGRSPAKAAAEELEASLLAWHDDVSVIPLGQAAGIGSARPGVLAVRRRQDSSPAAFQMRLRQCPPVGLVKFCAREKAIAASCMFACTATGRERGRRDHSETTVGKAWRNNVPPRSRGPPAANCQRATSPPGRHPCRSLRIGEATNPGPPSIGDMAQRR